MVRILATLCVILLLGGCATQYRSPGGGLSYVEFAFIEDSISFGPVSLISLGFVPDKHLQLTAAVAGVFVVEFQTLWDNVEDDYASGSATPAGVASGPVAHEQPRDRYYTIRFGQE